MVVAIVTAAESTTPEFCMSSTVRCPVTTCTLKKYAYSTGSRYGDGGGIYNAGEAYIYNCTIANSYAFATGGGIYNEENATLELISTIVADNDIAGSDPDNSDDLINLSDSLTASYCLIESGSGHHLLDGLDHNIIGQDASLTALDFWGGTTRSISLEQGSVAIDNGINPLDLRTDQRGPGYERLSGTAVDMGAIEAE